MKKKSTAKAEPKEKREYHDNKTVIDEGIKCPHCSERYGHTITNTYPNGNRRRLCGKCKMPFVTLRRMEP